jgi:hypothetical protein
MRDGIGSKGKLGCAGFLRLAGFERIGASSRSSGFDCFLAMTQLRAADLNKLERSARFFQLGDIVGQDVHPGGVCRVYESLARRCWFDDVVEGVKAGNKRPVKLTRPLIRPFQAR